MNTVTVGVTSREEINARFRRAMNGEPQVNACFLEKLDDGRIEFPFDAIHVDFMLRAVS